MKLVKSGVLRLSLVAAVLCLAACGNLVKLSMNSDKALNTNTAGTALPVVVRVYQLSDDTAFRGAAFRDLWKKDTEVLGSSLLSFKEITMQPNSTEAISEPLNEKTKFVAGVAIFRNPDMAKWSFVEPVSDGVVAGFWHKLFPVSVSLHLSQNRLEVND